MEKILRFEDFKLLSLDNIIEKYIQGYSLSDRYPLKIALVSTPFFRLPPINYGGLEILVWDLAEALDELGHDITLLAPENSRSTKHGKLFVTGPEYTPQQVNWLDEETKRYEKYKDFLILENFNIIHDHSWYGLVYKLKKEYPNFNSKILHTHHAGFYPEFTILKGVKQNMIGVSKHMTEITKSHLSSLNPGSLAKLAYNGIDTDIYKYYKDVNIKKNNRLLFVSILSKNKGPDTAIQVAKKANLPLDIITTIPDVGYENEIKSMITDANNSGIDIQFYKDTTKEFKIRKMQESKVFLFPTLFEALGLVALESMACGTPVITLNTNGPNETVIDGKTGFICKDIDGMVEAVKNIDKINPLECRKRAEEFSRINMAKEHVKLYEQAIRGEEW